MRVHEKFSKEAAAEEWMKKEEMVRKMRREKWMTTENGENEEESYSESQRIIPVLPQLKATASKFSTFDL